MINSTSYWAFYSYFIINRVNWLHMAGRFDHFWKWMKIKKKFKDTKGVIGFENFALQWTVNDHS